MGNYKQTIMTDSGLKMYADLLREGGRITYTRCVTSAWQYPENTDYKKLEELLDIRQAVVPSDAKVISDTTFSVGVTFDTKELTEAYYARNIGLYASDGEKEVLFAVCAASEPDLFPAYNKVAPNYFTFNMTFVVDSTENIVIEIDPDGVLTAKSVIDNLESRSQTQPLSANQGRILREWQDSMEYLRSIKESSSQAIHDIVDGTYDPEHGGGDDDDPDAEEATDEDIKEITDGIWPD